MVHGRPPEPDHSLTSGLGGMEVAMIRLGTFPEFEGIPVRDLRASQKDPLIVGHDREFHKHSLKSLNGKRFLPLRRKVGAGYLGELCRLARGVVVIGRG
jgi:hypothetical protein